MSFSEQAFERVVKYRIADDLFAQVSSEGRRVTLFQKGLPLQFSCARLGRCTRLRGLPAKRQSAAMTQTLLISQHSPGFLIVDKSDWVHHKPPPGAPISAEDVGSSGRSERNPLAGRRATTQAEIAGSDLRAYHSRSSASLGDAKRGNIEHDVGAVGDHSIGLFAEFAIVESSRTNL